ncbi:MAG: helix-turn-helix domain-containing protein [Patescibacteria group bacterium]
MKQTEFNIKDESSDRAYFSIVPNYIVNHSTLEERGFYLTLKRIAGERGRVYYSARELGKKCGISKNTVYRLLESLINRGWIKTSGTIPAKTKPRTTYAIVDLWEQNAEFYRHKKIVPNGGQSSENKEIVSNRGQTSSQLRDTKEEQGKEENITSLLESGPSEKPKVSRKTICPNLQGHQKCIENIHSVEAEFGKKFVNFPKQISALHKLYKAGFSDEQINHCLNAMDKDKFWNENGWDLMNVANTLSKGGKKYGI